MFAIYLYCTKDTKRHQTVWHNRKQDNCNAQNSIFKTVQWTLPLQNNSIPSNIKYRKKTLSGSWILIFFKSKKLEIRFAASLPEHRHKARDQWKITILCQNNKLISGMHLLGVLMSAGPLISFHFQTSSSSCNDFIWSANFKIKTFLELHI